jgi:hypothetical protein
VFRIVYVSRNLIADQEEADAGLERVLAAARARNAALGVTGALLFSEDAFAQVLEGPVEAVTEVFDLIQTDARHDGVVVLHSGPVAARGFGAWSMAYAGRVDDAGARYRALLGAGPGADSARGVVEMLRAVLDRQAAAGRGALPAAT